MDLHRAFIDVAADQIRGNSAALFGMVKLNAKERLPLVPHLWSTLFLVVPVVSTTFASVARRFARGAELRDSLRCADRRQTFTSVRYRLESGIASRTVANEMSHLRAVLKQVGKQGLARNPAYSNRSLGIPQGSRIGTKQPLSDAQIRAFQERMEWLGRPNIGAIFELQRALGLAKWKLFAPARQIRSVAGIANWRRADARACSTAPNAGDPGSQWKTLSLDPRQWR